LQQPQQDIAEVGRLAADHLRKYGRVFLDIDFVGEGEISFEKPPGKITESSQGKFVYGIIIKNIKKGSEKIEDDYGGSEGNNKTVFVIKTEKIIKVLIPA
jgi:hypothetical protein